MCSKTLEYRSAILRKRVPNIVVFWSPVLKDLGHSSQARTIWVEDMASRRGWRAAGKEKSEAVFILFKVDSVR